MPINWTTENIPDLTNKTAIVTGANSGVGFETTLELVKHGCTVIMACRNEEKANNARLKILAAAPDVNPKSIIIEKLDLADFKSVHAFCKKIQANHKNLSLLVNNAGVMGLPFIKTVDGNEMVFQTNYLGQFVLTEKLYPLIALNRGRIIEVSSNTNQVGNINLEELQCLDEKHYKPSSAYPNSKLAALIFSFELNRRLVANKQPVISVAAHPGYCATEILLKNKEAKLKTKFFELGNRLVAQSAKAGAIPILYACVGEDVQGGLLYGPDGWPQEMRGNYPKISTTVSKQAYDRQVAIALWEKSEKLLGIKFFGEPEISHGHKVAMN